MGNRWGNSGNSVRLYFLGSTITADGDCSHEIKRCLLLGRRVMTNLDSIFKSRDITLPTKIRLVKAMVWTWLWVNSGSWWCTGRPGVLRFMGSQRVGHDWVTELNWNVLQLQPASASQGLYLPTLNSILTLLIRFTDSILVCSIEIILRVYYSLIWGNNCWGKEYLILPVFS